MKIIRRIGGSGRSSSEESEVRDEDHPVGRRSGMKIIRAVGAWDEVHPRARRHGIRPATLAADRALRAAERAGSDADRHESGAGRVGGDTDWPGR